MMPNVVTLDLELVISDDDPSKAEPIKAMLTRTEDITENPDDSGKFDLVIPSSVATESTSQAF
jgi:hypothetical protein